jgi:hypothetical protein
MIQQGRNVVLGFLGAVLLSGCLSPQVYVDPALPAAGKESVAPVAKPQPVQVLYEFRTKGAVNARATEFSSPFAMEVLRDSGLFSEISSAPVASQRRLSITVANVPITSEGDAMAKGFGVGLTFGLVGTMVTDGYDCEATFSAPGTEPLKLNFKHALHTALGNTSGPPGVTGQKVGDAVKALITQLTWSVLRDLSKSGRL